MYGMCVNNDQKCNFYKSSKITQQQQKKNKFKQGIVNLYNILVCETIM